MQVRLTSSLGASPLPNMDEFSNTTKLPISWIIASSIMDFMGGKVQMGLTHSGLLQRGNFWR